LFGDVFADACGSDHIARAGSQHRIVPANEPPLGCSRENLVLVMPGIGRIGEERREKFFQIVVDLIRYKDFEPVSPEDFLVPPAGEAEKMVVAVDDPCFSVDHH